jgi:hypothetical protein
VLSVLLRFTDSDDPLVSSISPCLIEFIFYILCSVIVIERSFLTFEFVSVIVQSCVPFECLKKSLKISKGHQNP